MRIQDQLTDREVMTELGRRLRQARLGQNLTQRQVATEAGVSEVTVNKIEKGDPAQLVTLLRILRALGLLDQLETALPETAPSPIDQLERRGRMRRRASSPRDMERPADAGPWRWGDEEQGGER